METETLSDIEVDTETIDPEYAHYYDTKKWDVTAAAIEGTPIRAICGLWLVPKRDPLKLPVCDKCIYVAENICKQ